MAKRLQPLIGPVQTQIVVHARGQRRADMILIVCADLGRVLDNLDAMAVQLRPWTDAGEHQQLGRLKAPGGQHDFPPRGDQHRGASLVHGLDRPRPAPLDPQP